MMPDPDNIRGNKRERLISWVQTVLRRWDPIGVVDAAADEYDSYAPKIADLLEQGVGQRKIALHLLKLEELSMGLSPNPERAERIASILVSGFQGETRPKGQKKWSPDGS